MSVKPSNLARTVFALRVLARPMETCVVQAIVDDQELRLDYDHLRINPPLFISRTESHLDTPTNELHQQQPHTTLTVRQTASATDSSTLAVTDRAGREEVE